MPIDLHSLPRLQDSISFIYIEHAVVEKRNESIEIIRKGEDKRVERIPVPVAKTTCILLGPGTTVTHAAISVMAETGCSCIWCGEHLRRFYASGIGETKSSRNLLLQARLCMNEESHMEVVRRMYEKRFPDFSFTQMMTLEQMRGMEGTRMKSIYKVHAARVGIKWKGRNYTPGSIEDSDIVNQALTISNSLLYSICQAAIVSLGLSPGLGFIHTGNAMSFVYDIADLYKAETAIPASFDAAKKYQSHTCTLEEITRRLCRDYFVKCKILKTIPKDIAHIFGSKATEDHCEDRNELWVFDSDPIKGSINYANEEDEEW